VDIRLEIELASGLPIREISSLSGGSVGQVYQARSEDGAQFVAKVDNGPNPCLDVEAFMLDYLLAHSNLPVPQTVFYSPSLLIMTRLPGESIFPPSVQEHAAELLAELHDLTSPSFGFDRPTLIGGLRQPNAWTQSWIPFFGEQRLLYMAEQAATCGCLPNDILGRIEKLAANLDGWLEEPPAPALIHGDVWTTNVLATNGQVSGFVDPAIYYAAPEIELAFITLFNTFGEPFFKRYHELRPISAGFFEERRDIYNLYPLLVHVRLFGGSYVARVDRILSRFGF
jgi:fructosamine-3-kinase